MEPNQEGIAGGFVDCVPASEIPDKSEEEVAKPDTPTECPDRISKAINVALGQGQAAMPVYPGWCLDTEEQPTKT